MDDPQITELEWQAVLVGARVLRDIATSFRASGAAGVAAECEAHADTLEELSRRAVVAATPSVDLEVER